MKANIRSTWTVLAALAIGGNACNSWGQTPTTGAEAQPSAARPQQESPPGLDFKQRFVLLQSGRVIEGEIAADPAGGYLHRRTYGVLRYDDAMVAAAADTLEELYAIRTKLAPPNDIPERLKIVDWCVNLKLTEQAIWELEQILKYDPGNAMAIRRLRRLTRAEVDVEKPAAAKSAEPMTVAVDPTQVIADFKSAHGQEAFDHFRVIENILMNRCASAGCHGSPQYNGEFRLVRPRQGNLSDARMTARNLQTVLDLIDARQPANSPILVMALEGRNHGPRNTAPMAGINDPLFQDLKDWVYGVAESSIVERSRVDTPSRKKLARNRTYGSLAAKPLIHPLWHVDNTPRGRIVLDDGTVQDYHRGPAGSAAPGGRGNSRSPSEAVAGNDVEKGRPGFGGMVADDAPPKAPARKESAPNKTKPPVGGSDPNDPEAFNNPKAAPAAKPKTTSAIPQSIALPAGKRGETFQAAPGPINGKQPQ